MCITRDMFLEVDYLRPSLRSSFFSLLLGRSVEEFMLLEGRYHHLAALTVIVMSLLFRMADQCHGIPFIVPTDFGSLDQGIPIGV